MAKKSKTKNSGKKIQMILESAKASSSLKIFSIAILLIVIVILVWILISPGNLTDLLTGNVAITTNVLNESIGESSEKTIGGVNLLLIFVIVLVAVFILANYLRTKQEPSNEI